jgi:hypothetical protein
MNVELVDVIAASAIKAHLALVFLTCLPCLSAGRCWPVDVVAAAFWARVNLCHIVHPFVIRAASIEEPGPAGAGVRGCGQCVHGAAGCGALLAV